MVKPITGFKFKSKTFVFPINLYGFFFYNFIFTPFKTIKNITYISVIK